MDCSAKMNCFFARLLIPADGFHSRSPVFSVDCKYAHSSLPFRSSCVLPAAFRQVISNHFLPRPACILLEKLPDYWFGSITSESCLVLPIRTAVATAALYAVRLLESVGLHFLSVWYCFSSSRQIRLLVLRRSRLLHALRIARRSQRPEVPLTSVLMFLPYAMVGAEGFEPPIGITAWFTARSAAVAHHARPNISPSFTIFSAPASAYLPSANLIRYTGIALMT